MAWVKMWLCLWETYFKNLVLYVLKLCSGIKTPSVGYYTTFQRDFCLMGNFQNKFCLFFSLQFADTTSVNHLNLNFKLLPILSREITQLVRFSTCKHEVLGSEPQHSCRNSDTELCN